MTDDALDRSRQRLQALLRPLIASDRVLGAVLSVPRELFVDPDQAELAYDNAPLPIGCGQTISQPLVVARMCELLDPQQDDNVLDVGTGSGYHAAVLARLARRVWSIERHEELAARAAENLHSAGIANVTVLVGDGMAGVPEHSPYDAINVAAAAQGDIPSALEQQLADGGRMVAPVQASGWFAGQHLVLDRRDGDQLRRTVLEPVRFVPLVE